MIRSSPMATHHSCDICGTEICLPSFGWATPEFNISAPILGEVIVETCLTCLTSIVQMIGERFPNARSSFVDRTLDDLAKLRAAIADFRSPAVSRRPAKDQTKCEF